MTDHCIGARRLGRAWGLSGLVAMNFGGLALSTGCGSSSVRGVGPASGHTPTGGIGGAISASGSTSTSGGTAGTSMSGGTAGMSTKGGTAGMNAGTGGTPGIDGLPWLHVSGNAIYDSSGNVIVLRGAATIDVGSRDNWTGITDPVQQIRASIDLVTAAGWKARVIRLPVYGSGGERAGADNLFPENGPVSAQEAWFHAFLEPAVAYATGKKLYVIIDWHEVASARVRNSATKAFWTYMGPKFTDQSNVLYEVFNEDSDTNQWSDWRPLAQGWVDIIRGAGAPNVVLVGGPMWAQTIGDSATDPVRGDNVVYVAHAYPSHYNDAWSKNHIETEIARAAAAAPVFIGEWGYSASDATIPGYLAWIRGFASTYGSGWSAWVISPSWVPSMFNADRSPTPFGQTTKDWLAEY